MIVEGRERLILRLQVLLPSYSVEEYYLRRYMWKRYSRYIQPSTTEDKIKKQRFFRVLKSFTSVRDRPFQASEYTCKYVIK